MIRYVFINNKVLELYSKLHKIEFPLDVKQIIDNIPNCRYMSYQQFAAINNCSINDVIQICESKSGCTHYDILKNRYLILCNQSSTDNNNPGRQRWTCGHEIGHIVCNHHIISAYEKLSENSLVQISNPQYELEADYFTSVLLAPFPIIKYLNLNTQLDIQQTFGLSTEAAMYRFKEYLKWKQSHRKTAWENDLVSLFKRKGIC